MSGYQVTPFPEANRPIAQPVETGRIFSSAVYDDADPPREPMELWLWVLSLLMWPLSAYFLVGGIDWVLNNVIFKYWSIL